MSHLCSTQFAAFRPLASYRKPTALLSERSAAAFAKQRRGDSASGSDGPAAAGRVTEDVELFNIDSGWNVESLDASTAGELLEGIEEWSVSSFVESEQVNQESGEINSITFSIEDEDEEKAGAGGPPSPAPQTREKVSPPSKLASERAEQALLRRLPAHVAKQLTALQEEADEERVRLSPENQRKVKARQRTHRRLRIISGSASGVRIFSPQGDQTRPMMEMVRGAVFNMICTMHNDPCAMPDNTRWLDLFAGTGAVGIEALSRGCIEAHFVELSPWVASQCLERNLELCGVEDAAVVHTMRAEDFLKRATKVPRFASGAFDFVSLCPPYELVSYTELYDLLEESPLLHAGSIVVVEYPKRVSREIRDTLGPLVKLRDRKYGRTLVAVYGPDDEFEDDSGSEAEYGSEEEED